MRSEVGRRRELGGVSGRRRLQVDGEVEGVQLVVRQIARRAEVVVDTAHALQAGAVAVPAQALRVVDQLEVEGVGVACDRAFRLHVLHATGAHVGHGEHPADGQQLAVEQQRALIEPGLRRDRESQPVVARVHIRRVEQRGRERNGVRPAVRSQGVPRRRHRSDRRRRRRQNRVVVDRAHVDADVGRARDARRARAAAAVCDHHIETIGVRIGRRRVLVAVAGVAVGESAARRVGEGETGRDVVRRDQVSGAVRDGRAVGPRDRACEEKRAVCRQRSKANGERAIGIVATARGGDEAADIRLRRGTVVRIGRLAFVDVSRARGRWQLVERRDVQRDGGGV